MGERERGRQRGRERERERERKRQRDQVTNKKEGEIVKGTQIHVRRR